MQRCRIDLQTILLIFALVFGALVSAPSRVEAEEVRFVPQLSLTDLQPCCARMTGIIMSANSVAADRFPEPRVNLTSRVYMAQTS